MVVTTKASANREARTSLATGRLRFDRLHWGSRLTAAGLGLLRVERREWYSDGSDGGDTVSTEAVAARRHAGRHLPAIGWNNTTGNSQLALAA